MGITLLLAICLQPPKTLAHTAQESISAVNKDCAAAFYLPLLRCYEFARGRLGAAMYSRFELLRSSAVLSSDATPMEMAILFCDALTFHAFKLRLILLTAVIIRLSLPAPK